MQGEGSIESRPSGARTLSAAIVGAQGCATTSLAHALGAHPDIRLAADRGPQWFDDPVVQRGGIDSGRWAERLPGGANETVLLDASPNYLYLPGCIEALHRHNPGARVIAVLRDPGERARSHFAHEARLGTLKVPYWRALVQEGRRLRAERNPLGRGSAARVASLRDRGRYSRQVAHLLEWFPDALILRFDEVTTTPALALRRITDFLGLAPFSESCDLPWLNARDRDRRPALIDRAVRWTLRKDMRATEELLGWDPGSLANARLGYRWSKRPNQSH